MQISVIDKKYNNILKLLNKYSCSIRLQIIKGIVKYQLINHHVFINDETFRKIYTDFYQLYKKDNLIKKSGLYFYLLNKYLVSNIDCFEIYKLVEEKLRVETGDQQVVFSTKLVHTINHDFPIVDTNVANYFGFSTKDVTIETLKQIYEFYQNVIQNNQNLFDKFRSAYQIDNSISGAKIIDFCIWTFMSEEKRKKK